MGCFASDYKDDYDLFSQDVDTTKQVTNSNEDEDGEIKS
jgi:hypothetical protein